MDYEPKTNTFMGYDAAFLTHAAMLLRQEGITPDMFGSYASGFKMGYHTAEQEIADSISETIKEFMSNGIR